MLIGERIREIRVAKKLTQADIQRRTGLFRPHISRVERGQTVPAIETLEKMAGALKVPFHQLFYEGEDVPLPPKLPEAGSREGKLFGAKEKEAAYLAILRRALTGLDRGRRQLLLKMARKMTKR